MASEGAPKIRLSRVSKVFEGGRGEQVEAIHVIDLAIREGEFYCLLGPSGCGKSTALNLIAGFDTPSAGEITLDGEPVRGPAPDRAVVFQRPLLFPWLRVIDNIALGLKFARVGRGEAHRRAGEYVEEMGLEGFERRYPYELSGGMQQRVALARAWINTPRILLLDEPFGALDAQTRVSMQELLLRIWERHATTILFITHDVEEAIFLGDRFGVMSARPAVIREELEVDLPRPRTIEMITEDRFVALKKRVIALLHPEGAGEHPHPPPGARALGGPPSPASGRG